ncbi:LysR substrate-binding domain-containing protein [Hydrogenophaga sp.]|uniref:LysR substrate-binding domain-containing protein n=1 Tax=Hydrogenophaga sp. TaxID=1904254 RepID=UPI00262623E6|nr:LysR substrate-binding domain-containing protein [Hydrogenophaga sp.]MCW5655580.1 LysR family transcriptional regulator [Hydrogenophaga sp.]
MELRHLRYFDAVAETQNFTRAAERLHVTQSTLSHQIRQLEEELGMVLFDRSHKRVALTEAGEMLRSHLVPALQQIDRGLQSIRQAPEALVGELRIGATHSFNTRLVPLCVSSFVSHHPGIRVSVEELSAELIARRLASGHLDLGVSYRPDDRPELWFEPLYNEELRLVVASAHPLARRRRVRMIELNHCRMVLLPTQFSTRKLLDDCFEAAGAQPRVMAELNSIAPMIELIRQTDLAGIIAETAVTPSPDLRVVPIEDPTPIRTPGLLWKKGANRSPMVKHMASVIRRAAMGPSS